MVAGLIVAGLAAAWWNLRWWSAGLVGTIISELAFLYWVPLQAWSTWIAGFLPFAAAPAFAAAAIGTFVRKKVTQWRA